jgi:hypothetical protein
VFGSARPGIQAQYCPKLPRNDKLDFSEIKNFCSVKDLVKKTKRQHTGRKFLPNTYLT